LAGAMSLGAGFALSIGMSYQSVSLRCIKFLGLFHALYQGTTHSTSLRAGF